MSLTYYALVNSSKSPGVAKKINGVVFAAHRIGIDADARIHPTNFTGVINFLIGLIKENSDVIIIRFSDLVSPIVFFVITYKRIFGSKIIIDIPTPRSVVLKESYTAIQSTSIRIMRNFLTLVSSSWVLLPAHRIIQYADESVYFSFGISGKTIKIGNGIFIDKNMPLTSANWPSKQLNLIGVAKIANWHGYDLVIDALALVKNMNLPYRVTFTIVGEGDELNFLKNKVINLGLSKCVFFTGMLINKELDDVFDKMHIGIASLALHRKGLSEASDLKTREYMARGIPVISSGKDFDFDENCSFRFVVTQDHSVKEIVSLIENYEESFAAKPKDVRRYAEERLSMDVKLKIILDI